MTSITLIWILGGALAVLVGMLVVLIVARSLDGSQAASRAEFAAKLNALATKASKTSTSNSSGWVSGIMAQSLTALAAASQTGKDEDTKQAATDGQKQIKQLITGLAIAGGVILAIVGAIMGDGN